MSIPTVTPQTPAYIRLEFVRKGKHRVCRFRVNYHGFSLTHSVPHLYGKPTDSISSVSYSGWLERILSKSFCLILWQGRELWSTEDHWGLWKLTDSCQGDSEFGCLLCRAGTAKRELQTAWAVLIISCICFIFLLY